MSDDDRRLAQRLRAYESRVPDAPEPSTSFSRGRMPWGVAAVAAAALGAAVLIGGNLLNEANVGEADPTATVSSVPSASASPTDAAEPSREPSGTPEPSAAASPSEEPSSPAPTSVPQPAISGVAWDEEAVEFPGDARIFKIIAESGRFHAVGEDASGAAVWSSSDGARWEQSTLPYPSEWTRDRGEVYVGNLVAFDERLVAIGTIRIADYLEVVAWESPDGSTWREIDTGDFRVDGFLVEDVSNGPGGLVAITHQYAMGSGSAWRSPDGGRTWTEHRPPGGELTLSAVVGTTRGYLIGGGEHQGSDGVTAPRIWYSPDGMGSSWVPASLEGDGGPGAIGQLAIDGSGRWVAIGTLNDRVAAWRSTDRGVSWQVVADLGPVESVGAGFSLAAAPDGFIAVSGTDPATTWTSADGATWQAGSPTRPSSISADRAMRWQPGIARIGDVVVVAGNSFTTSGDFEEESFTWRGRIVR